MQHKYSDVNSRLRFLCLLNSLSILRKIQTLSLSWALLHVLVPVTFTPVDPVLFNTASLMTLEAFAFVFPVPASVLFHSFWVQLLSSRQQLTYLCPWSTSGCSPDPQHPSFFAVTHFLSSYHWGQNLALVSLTALVWIWNVHEGSCVKDHCTSCGAAGRGQHLLEVGTSEGSQDSDVCPRWGDYKLRPLSPTLLPGCSKQFALVCTPRHNVLLYHRSKCNQAKGLWTTTR